MWRGINTWVAAFERGIAGWDRDNKSLPFPVADTALFDIDIAFPDGKLNVCIRARKVATYTK